METYSSECLFCKIIQGEIPAEKVYEDDNVLAFKDIYPQAKVHILFIPKNGHVASLNEVSEADKPILADLQWAAIRYAKDKELDQSGYRTVVNCGDEGGQTVFHLHLHLLAGQQLGAFGAPN